ncbi:glycosyltransferase family 1 protein [Dermacoccus nishinomiyaensis]|nr:glycosyltransferase family 1 protein [Dermacoccus nishinomiyaensis]
MPRGAFSDATSRGAQEIPRLRGVLLVGGEGWDDAELPGAVERAVPQVHWRTPDADHPVEVLLATADVVVTHAGQNALADVAAFGVPAVVVPQERPFDEQADMARALDDAGIARGLTLGATADEVAAGIRELLAGGDERSTGRAWARWCVDGAVDRAADVIEAAARGGVADLAAGTDADDLEGAVRGSRHGIDDVARAGVAERGVREAGGVARGVEGGSGWPAATGAEAPALGDGTLQ